jgi:DNA-directed RNA polymerase subunit RPC12/RpoP
MSCNNCHRCLDGARTEYGIPITATKMIVCPECGNKRCPKATDHEFKCTNNNEPGQPGSVYSTYNFKTVNYDL